MEPTKPRSVLAAFQEHLQLASSKCGSLMEQLNIVRKKVEGEESNDALEPISYQLLEENESIKNESCAKKSDILECKDEHKNKQMPEENIESHIEENSSHDERENFILSSPQTEVQEQISGKPGIENSLEKNKNADSHEISSDDNSISSHSLGSCQGTSDKKNIYEELLKRLQDTEKRNSTKSRSSSENSSSTMQQSCNSVLSSKNNWSDCTINEDKLEKKNSEIDNLNISGVDFFLPSSITQKFQEIFYEDSNEEVQDTDIKEKNGKVTFSIREFKNQDLKNSAVVKKKEEKKIYKNHESKHKNTKILISSKQNNTQKIEPNEILRKEANVLDKIFETSSIKTETRKSFNKSLEMNLNFHSPELKLYKKLNAAPKVEIKRAIGKKEFKPKKNIAIKVKNINTLKENHLKNLPEKKKSLSPEKLLKNKIKEEKDDSSDIKIQKISGIKSVINNNKHFDGTIQKISENKIRRPTEQHIKNNEKKQTLNIIIEEKTVGASMETQNKIMASNQEKQNPKTKNIQKENLQNFEEKQQKLSKNNQIFRTGKFEQASSKLNSVPPTAKNPVKKNKPKPANKEYSEHSVEKTVISSYINNKNINESQSSSPLQPPNSKKESSKKEDQLAGRTPNRNKNKDQTQTLTGKTNLSKETVYSQNMSDMKYLTKSFPFILGQSTTKSYNVRAAIQQTMSMIMKSPAETLRRSSFSEMLQSSSKASTQKTFSSDSSGRRVCPACVIRVDEEEDDLDESPVDPWDTDYHRKRFIRCTCMPRNTVNFKTVINQLLQETDYSHPLPSEGYQESELENGEESRTGSTQFLRRNNNIHKLSKLLHNLLRIRDVLIT